MCLNASTASKGKEDGRTFLFLAHCSDSAPLTADDLLHGGMETVNGDKQRVAYSWLPPVIPHKLPVLHRPPKFDGCLSVFRAELPGIAQQICQKDAHQIMQPEHAL